MPSTWTCHDKFWRISRNLTAKRWCGSSMQNLFVRVSNYLEIGRSPAGGCYRAPKSAQDLHKLAIVLFFVWFIETLSLNFLEIAMINCLQYKPRLARHRSCCFFWCSRHVCVFSARRNNDEKCDHQTNRSDGYTHCSIVLLPLPRVVMKSRLSHTLFEKFIVCLLLLKVANDSYRTHFFWF